MPTKEIVIMRGLSGSGKSTHAKKWVHQPVICSADHFWNKSGTYQFNPHQIGESHAYCHGEFLAAIGQQSPIIVIDNTNAQKWQYANYITEGNMWGYSTLVVDMGCPTEDDVWHFWKRGTHNVPISVMMNMWDKWEHDPTDDRFKTNQTTLGTFPRMLILQRLQNLFEVWEVPHDYNKSQSRNLPHCGIKKAEGYEGRWYGRDGSLIWDTELIYQYDLLF